MSRQDRLLQADDAISRAATDVEFAANLSGTQACPAGANPLSLQIARPATSTYFARRYIALT